MTRLYDERDLPPDAWDAPDPLADMTRQRDEAVKAFQRERARVGRLSDDALLTDMVEQAAAAVWQQLEAEHFGAWSIQLPQTRHHVKESMLPTVVAVRDALVAALADRPTDD